MSKKKNTLQDLDDFLKQQAATLVTPESLHTSTAPAAGDGSDTQHQPTTKPSLLESNVLGSKHDPAFRKKLYDFIIDALENQQDSLPEDKMLINTALYLKGGSDWKNVVREYWRRR